MNQLQCSKKGGETDTLHKSNTRNAAGSTNQSIASGGVIPKDTVKSTPSDCLSPVTEGREESQQLDPIQLSGTITEDTPVALRTRRCRQQMGPTSINDGEGDLSQATHQERNKDKELIRRLRNLYFAQFLHRGVTRQLGPEHEGPSSNHMVHHPTLTAEPARPRPPD